MAAGRVGRDQGLGDGVPHSAGGAAARRAGAGRARGGAVGARRGGVPGGGVADAAGAARARCPSHARTSRNPEPRPRGHGCAAVRLFRRPDFVTNLAGRGAIGAEAALDEHRATIPADEHDGGRARPYSFDAMNADDSNRSHARLIPVLGSDSSPAFPRSDNSAKRLGMISVPPPRNSAFRALLLAVTFGQAVSSR